MTDTPRADLRTLPPADAIRRLAPPDGAGPVHGPRWRIAGRRLLLDGEPVLHLAARAA